MADINVDVSLPNSINVDVTSPTQSINANLSIPDPLINNVIGGTQSLIANISAVGPQGPIGPQGPSGVQGPSGLQGLTGPQGPSGEINTGALDLRYYSINNPSGFITGVDLSNYVTKTNGQFNDRPTVNGTGVLLSGEATNLPNTIVYTTGDQNISGNKTFKENILVEGTGIFNSVDLSNISEFSFSGTNIILIDSSISISGQRPTVNGTGVLLSGEAAGGGGVLEKRHDFVTGDPYDYSYCGTAPENSLESASVWDITRLSIDSAGLVAFNQSVTNYSWTGRYLAPYV